MQTSASKRWAARVVTFLLGLMVAASAGYWGLRLSAGGFEVPAAISVAPSAQAHVDPAHVARALGGAELVQQVAAVPTLASRFVLVGVLAGASSRGAALISVDGRPAKPYRVGVEVDPGLFLQSVQRRQASLSSTLTGPTTLSLELPSLPKK